MKEESFQEMIKFLIFVILYPTNRNLLVREQDPHILLLYHYVLPKSLDAAAASSFCVHFPLQPK